MVRTQIQLTEKQASALKRLAAEKRISIAELVRQSIDVLLQTESGIGDAERRRRAKEAAGFIRSGLPDLATEHDRYLIEAYNADLRR